MSGANVPTLSMAFARVLSLQDELREARKELLSLAQASKSKRPGASSMLDLNLDSGILEAHKKLSDYLGKCFQSPYYLWAACECSIGSSCYLAKALSNFA
jgi:hypothetical protein